ncbi:hypothetical protein EIP91_012309 [Steccherinum ochraceum]|uniref:VWFA domain-containing protein n=1 Tax=Steccherinum ochraceum TaxID=92696 RepID=A0A4R0RX44_9APHY|nr:hypothetical protein EIP91_012309 [Steccherinum ochraceum]
MGNAQSNRSGRYSTASASGGASRISSPQSLGSSHRTVAPAAVRRRASASPTNAAQIRNLPPVQTHRRARSALAGSSSSVRNRDTAPPPTYSMAIADTEHLAPPPTALESPVAYPTPPLSPPALPNPPPSLASPRSTPGSSHTRHMTIPPAQAGPSTSRSSQFSRPTSPNSQPVENDLDYLRRYNTVFVIDDSASMRGHLWGVTRKALIQLAETAAVYDADGIDVCFFNSDRVARNVKHDPGIINSLFDSVTPGGLSLMGCRLEHLFLFYMDNLEKAWAEMQGGKPEAFAAIKPVNYIVITHGTPSDAPEEVIVEVAKRLDKGNFSLRQIGVQLVQIGKSEEAAAFLKYLDDDLKAEYGCRDMVDTTPYHHDLTGQVLLKILVGAVNGRIDRLNNETLGLGSHPTGSRTKSQ